MRDVDAPSRFGVRRRAPPQVLVIGRGSRGLAQHAGRRRSDVDVAGDRLRLRDAVDRVAHGAGVRVREREGERADLRVVRGRERAEIGRAEGRSGCAIERTRVRAHRGARAARHHQPHAAAIGVVGEPGAEERAALVREVQAPPGLVGSRTQPKALIAREVGVADRDGGAVEGLRRVGRRRAAAVHRGDTVGWQRRVVDQVRTVGVVDRAAAREEETVRNDVVRRHQAERGEALGRDEERAVRRISAIVAAVTIAAARLRHRGVAGEVLRERERAGDRALRALDVLAGDVLLPARGRGQQDVLHRTISIGIDLGDPEEMVGRIRREAQREHQERQSQASSECVHHVNLHRGPPVRSNTGKGQDIPNTCRSAEWWGLATRRRQTRTCPPAPSGPDGASAPRGAFPIAAAQGTADPSSLGSGGPPARGAAALAVRIPLDAPARAFHRPLRRAERRQPRGPRDVGIARHGARRSASRNAAGVHPRARLRGPGSADLAAAGTSTARAGAHHGPARSRRAARSRAAGDFTTGRAAATGGVPASGRACAGAGEIPARARQGDRAQGGQASGRQGTPAN